MRAPRALDDTTRRNERRWTFPSLPRLACADEPELLDIAGHDHAALRGNLEDLERINRWLGGMSLSLAALDQLTSRLAPGSAITILDVGCGGADISRAMLRHAERRRRACSLYGLDLSPDILRLGLEPSHGIVPIAADGRHLPLTDGAVDVAVCSLVLHHHDPPEAVALLHEMGRVSRLGIVVNDLIRCRHAYLGARLLTRCLTRNPLTRHDAPLSVRRAYTVAEMQELAATAGLRVTWQRGLLGQRVALIAERRP